MLISLIDFGEFFDKFCRPSQTERRYALSLIYLGRETNDLIEVQKLKTKLDYDVTGTRTNFN